MIIFCSLHFKKKKKKSIHKMKTSMNLKYIRYRVQKLSIFSTNWSTRHASVDGNRRLGHNI